MGYAVEALALVALAALGWRTWRAGAGTAAYAVVGLILALVVTGLVTWLSDALAALVTGNLLARLGIPLLTSMLAFALARRAWLRRAAWRSAWIAAFASRPGSARAVLVGVLLIQAALAVLLAAVAVNLIARRWPERDPGLRGRTLVARHLLIGSPPVPVPAGVPLGSDVAAVQQRRLASGLGRLFASGRDAVADATGMAPAMEAIDILGEINELDHAGKLWLVRNHPALGRLVDHPTLRAVATDPAVLDEIERVAKGSLPAAWRLGDRADIQGLFADPEIRAAVAAIHLADLRAAWRARRVEGAPVPVSWRLREGDGPELDLAEGSERLTGAETASTVTVRGWLPGEIGNYRLVITGLAMPRLLIGGQPCVLVVRVDGYEAGIAVTTTGGDVELTVQADAAPAGGFGLALSRIE